MSKVLIKNKGGAPRKEIRQSKAFKVYLTLDEFSVIKGVSEELGYPTISGLFREKILEFCSKRRISTANNPQIQAASAYLGGLAFSCHDLEQYASESELPEDVVDTIHGLLGKIEMIESFLTQ
ncbi:hypothetical protein DJ564_17895 [Pseudomonas sp. 31-12]|uniref:hypothetical protein n=1 Tax=Pseudomonas sp. 31-12 TaxID=2201356 RepID=UPI000D6C347D|nr:hypothetical protein [Pseudomonas sp. 31-12]AWM92550.1 hypothetical protein DJ564_17895 [Pseudomonas sp. 31-12]